MSNITEIYDDIIAGLEGDNDYVTQLYFKVNGCVSDEVDTGDSLNFKQMRYSELKQEVEMILEPYFCFKTLHYSDTRFVGFKYKLPIPIKAKDLDYDNLRRLELTIYGWFRLFTNLDVELINIKYIRDLMDDYDLENHHYYSLYSTAERYSFIKYLQLVEDDLEMNL